MPQKKAPYVSKFTESMDGPIKSPPKFVYGPRPPVPHKIPRKPVPSSAIYPPITVNPMNTPVPSSAIPLPQKAPVKVEEGSGCGCVVM
ncbi:hypothetical protein BPOR_0460g00070 [Botrytis porri]|uniref:Uncharacterized protein n=1 Tax=Botrytis porri TaxID=87229 RepID=A0A4Z1KFL6_9HELO|nr:hypothetical protein BPOR_0460g00070 [Botrytis porri]